MNAPLSPADMDTIEMPKIDEAISWLVGFVNRQLSQGSHYLTRGSEYRVHFEYDDFVKSYPYLVYWRDHAGDIADLFRERGWIVNEYEPNPKSRTDERQPSLGFKLPTS